MTWVNINGTIFPFPSYQSLLDYLLVVRKAGFRAKVWEVEQKGWAK